MDAAAFDAWLDSARLAFRGLGPARRRRALAVLLEECGPEELWRWQAALTDGLCRDVVAWLPVELAHGVLGYLDARSLFRAAAVSSAWRRRVDSAAGLWRRQVHLLGGGEPRGELAGDVQEWKKVAAASHHWRERIKTGKAFKLNHLRGYIKAPAIFAAMDYHAGHFAAATVDNQDANGQADKILIFDAYNLERPVREITQVPEGARISVVRLLHPRYAVAGRLDGRITVWDLRADTARDLPGHDGAAIFSLDADLSLDLIVSGSTDHRARLWRLSDGALLKTLSTQPHWTVAVLLRRGHPRNCLLTMSKKEVHVFRWSDGQGVKDLSESPPAAVLPLKPEGSYQELRDAFFTPGLSLSLGDSDGACAVTFVRQMPLFETQTIGDADVITVDADSGRMINGVHINQKVRKLLAVGKRYALALLPFVDAKVYKNLAVIDLVEKRIVGGCTVPHSRASTPDFSQIFVGETAWLDGLTPRMSGPVAGFSMQDGSIVVVEWADLVVGDGPAAALN